MYLCCSIQCGHIRYSRKNLYRDNSTFSGGAGCDEGGGGGETRKEGADDMEEEEGVRKLSAGPVTDPLRLEELMKQAPAPPAQPG